MLPKAKIFSAMLATALIVSGARAQIMDTPASHAVIMDPVLERWRRTDDPGFHDKDDDRLSGVRAH